MYLVLGVFIVEEATKKLSNFVILKMNNEGFPMKKKYFSCPVVISGGDCCPGTADDPPMSCCHYTNCPSVTGISLSFH